MCPPASVPPLLVAEAATIANRIGDTSSETWAARSCATINGMRKTNQINVSAHRCLQFADTRKPHLLTAHCRQIVRRPTARQSVEPVDLSASITDCYHSIEEGHASEMPDAPPVSNLLRRTHASRQSHHPLTSLQNARRQTSSEARSQLSVGPTRFQHWSPSLRHQTHSGIISCARYLGLTTVLPSSGCSRSARL